MDQIRFVKSYWALLFSLLVRASSQEITEIKARVESRLWKLFPCSRAGEIVSP